jgi:hypothetical protein
MALRTERWQCGCQGKHEVDSWMYTAIFTACAAYNSPELRLVMSQAYQSMETQWQDLQIKTPLTGPSKRCAPGLPWSCSEISAICGEGWRRRSFLTFTVSNWDPSGITRAHLNISLARVGAQHARS